MNKIVDRFGKEVKADDIIALPQNGREAIINVGCVTNIQRVGKSGKELAEPRIRWRRFDIDELEITAPSWGEDSYVTIDKFKSEGIIINNCFTEEQKEKIAYNNIK